jgi:hypothetical protein
VGGDGAEQLGLASPAGDAEGLPGEEDGVVLPGWVVGDGGEDGLAGGVSGPALCPEGFLEAAKASNLLD